MNTKIYIIGAGAIGKALSICLKHFGRDVILLRASTNEINKHKEEFKLSLPDGTLIREQININALHDTGQLNGLIILTNKSYGNERIAGLLKAKINHSPIVILQNGLGVERIFLREDFPHIYRCVLFATSQLTGPNAITFKPVTSSPIGITRGNLETLEKIIEAISTPFFPFIAEEQIEKIIWKKAIINCVYNSVCPLLEVDNGIFHRNEEAQSLAKIIIAECVEIALLQGIDLEASEVMKNLLQISRSSDGLLISTLQDIRNGRPTEIDTLNFEIARIAASRGKQDGVKVTRVLGDLTRLKSLIK